MNIEVSGSWYIWEGKEKKKRLVEKDILEWDIKRTKENIDKRDERKTFRRKSTASTISQWLMVDEKKKSNQSSPRFSYRK